MDASVTKDIPIIVISGRNAQEMQRLMFGLGVIAYLTKPLAMNDLIKKLRNHIKMPADRKRCVPQPKGNPLTQCPA